ncbi:heme lyase CcmF/NrfE family subunit [Vibrio sp. 404]|uniref:Heme lyase CcmF/NrfE family subunit n=1 Tax=Vibrio marinisediminis TaxID=2758441 RepID=A0A7W2FT14_9VIBR|nr:heme lyase CcmF/NrfE family subunit [Vibrio marinisediminis]MBA5763692.1 heme lyase CcmF/NrfE family subunit [Vibrio marinisediminis]
MVGEWGHFALIWVVVSSSVSAVYYAWQKQQKLVQPLSLSNIARLNGLLASLSLILLAVLFVQDQFQYDYVASHSNVALPIYFKVAAVWGGHQGSMLFWVFTLSLWSALISLKKGHERRFVQDVLWVMMLFVAAFGWFTLIASNPFVFSPSIVEQGRDLNPMLQDIGLIFHPPLLYLGYIGFSTVFAFALAALMNPTESEQWIRMCLPWALSAWFCLTVGILVGSWWAYNELGWGGWWFWDPVENASLLPWLTGTALLHAMVAVRRNQQMQLWALTLALITFCLSILGTFIVRSGILTSVHAFAVDPNKGIALLLILACAMSAGFVLLISRADSIKSRAIESLLSRSYLILLALGLLSVATLTVLLGTFYPMIYQMLGFGQVSVGAPYFNTLFLPLTVLVLGTMGMVPFVKSHSGVSASWRFIGVLFALSTLVGWGVYTLQVNAVSFTTLLVWGVASWVVIGHLYWVARHRKITFMILAHIGLAVSAVGAVMNSQHSYEMNKKMSPGTSIQVAEWQVDYLETNWYVGGNYTAQQGVVQFSQGERTFVLTPERRHYPVRVMNMSEPAIHSTWFGDYYLTLGPRVSAGAYAVKIQYKAYINWVWLGVLIAACGALLALLPGYQIKECDYVAKQA